MAKYQLLLPKMGESVAEATIIKWNKNPGDTIEADEAVMEIATDKVDSEVPSPVSGKLVEQLCNENDVVQVGAVIAIIETEEAEETREEIPTPIVEEPAAPLAEEPKEVNIPEAPAEEPIAPEPIPGIEQLEPKVEVEHTNGFSSSARFYSPLVKNIATQEGISVEELDKIPGTGAEGRLTKDDLLNYLQNPSSVSSVPRKDPIPAQEAPKAPIETSVPTPQAEKSAEPKAAPAVSVSGGDEIIEMDRMRRLIADHMVMSKQTSPHVTSFVEADVTNLVLWREKNKGAFEKKEGEKITFTPIFIEAVVKAIKDMPMINVSVNGNQIIKKANINIGMATALPSGNLIVPVIKKADELNLVGLTKAVNDLANRARNNKLQPDDVKDGTFTITNVGTFGNVMGTPIINQPQAAILAVGAIKKKPAVIETKTGDVIAIRHLMFLSLSYDHRVVDGALGGSFLRKIADYLEAWDIDRAV
ncbi:MAG TPA: dihydrolipoamide acetyltransferase family protein [Mucilaginibacter sp.]|nr:dihydrolipoamide acetyltransferase family protein [Mucilaginibacter sp.]